MLFSVTMQVDLPDMDPNARRDLLQQEREYSQQLQRGGEWIHIWRVVGSYANISIFDVADSDRLHEILWNLPLFPYMSIEVTPLAAHPSDIRGQ